MKLFSPFFLVFHFFSGLFNFPMKFFIPALSITKPINGSIDGPKSFQIMLLEWKEVLQGETNAVVFMTKSKLDFWLA